MVVRHSLKLSAQHLVISSDQRIGAVAYLLQAPDQAKGFFMSQLKKKLGAQVATAEKHSYYAR